MSLRLQQQLDSLRRHGITAADLTADEIAELVRACDRCDNPFSEVNAEAAGFPVKVVDGVYLWRYTAGACVWLDEYARRWWPETDKPYFWATVYALRHGREKGAFLGLTTEQAAFEAIRDEVLTINATEDEIIAAVVKITGVRDPSDDRKRKSAEPAPDWAALVRKLEAQTGIDADVWMWGKAAQYTAGAYHDLCEFAAASGGARTPRMKDELDRAVNALARLMAGIKRRIEAERAGGGA